MKAQLFAGLFVFYVESSNYATASIADSDITFPPYVLHFLAYFQSTVMLANVLGCH